MNLSFLIALMTAFINTAGVGIAFSFLHTLAFDPELGLLADASANTRGLFFGAVVAGYTFMPFLFSPITGTLSDQKGRRSLLLPTLLLSACSFGLSALSIELKSMYGLLFSRVLAGIAASNVPVAQAVIADLSTPENRLKNFGFMAIAVGSGFTLGPFLGGLLGLVSLSFPFWFFSFLSLFVFFITYFFFKETYKPSLSLNKPSFLKGFYDLKKVFKIKKLRYFILMMCLFFFGWEIFFPFASVLLCSRYNYGCPGTGLFFGVAGGLYTIGGYFLRVASRYPLRGIFQICVPLFAFILVLMWLFPAEMAFWGLLVPLMLVAPLFFTGAFTYVSALSSEDEQGEMLGIYNSLQQFALTFPPLLFGPFVARNPEFIVIGAAFFCFLAWIPSLFIPKSVNGN